MISRSQRFIALSTSLSLSFGSSWAVSPNELQQNHPIQNQSYLNNLNRQHLPGVGNQFRNNRRQQHQPMSERQFNTASMRMARQTGLIREGTYRVEDKRNESGQLIERTFFAKGSGDALLTLSFTGGPGGQVATMTLHQQDNRDGNIMTQIPTSNGSNEIRSQRIDMSAGTMQFTITEQSARSGVAASGHASAGTILANHDAFVHVSPGGPVTIAAVERAVASYGSDVMVNMTVGRFQNQAVVQYSVGRSGSTQLAYTSGDKGFFNGLDNAQSTDTGQVAAAHATPVQGGVPPPPPQTNQGQAQPAGRPTHTTITQLPQTQTTVVSQIPVTEFELDGNQYYVVGLNPKGPNPTADLQPSMPNAQAQVVTPNPVAQSQTQVSEQNQPGQQDIVTIDLLNRDHTSTGVGINSVNRTDIRTGQMISTIEFSILPSQSERITELDTTGDNWVRFGDPNLHATVTFSDGSIMNPPATFSRGSIHIDITSLGITDSSTIESVRVPVNNNGHQFTYNIIGLEAMDYGFDDLHTTLTSNLR